MPTRPCLSLYNARAQLLSALGASADAPRLKQLLARAVVLGLWRDDPFVAARAVAACAARDLSLAQLAFDACARPTAFAYNSLIRAHSAGPFPDRSLLLFRGLLRSGLYPDRFTIPFLLRACARALSCSGPSTAHALVLRHGLERDPHVGTSLLHAYASSDRIEDARKVFDEMPEKTTVTWNALISCCSRSMSQDEGLAVFAEMLNQGSQTNADTLVAAVSCCAGLGALAHGKGVHALATRLGAGGHVEVGASLVHMYAKCGNLEYGTRVFEEMESRDVSTWTAMVGGLAMHGRGREALALFERMVEEGIQPDSLTFTSVLHACSHSGLADIGIRLFNDMKEVHGIEARMEHYGAMVDLLGRAGRLDAAEQFIRSMPFEPNRVILGSLLHACAVNGKLGLGVLLEKQVLELEMEGEQGGFSVGVSNVYASDGRWDEVGRVRERMVGQGVRKEKGYSLVEVDGRMHKFLVGDKWHPLTDQIHRLLFGITREICYTT